MPCKLCIERGKPEHFGSDPRCAWPTGRGEEPFNADNWACATALKLRDLAGEDTDESGPSEERMYVRREDQSYGAFYVPPDFDLFACGGFIAMTWYKSRGKTDVIVRIDDHEGATPLMLAEAEAAIAICAKSSNK